MSAYDLLPSDEREAIAWVRERGGIEAVKEEWNHSRNLKRSLETAQAKVERQQRHIEFVQRKCRERQEHIVELNKTVSDMRLRLMPEPPESYGLIYRATKAGEVDFGEFLHRCKALAERERGE